MGRPNKLTANAIKRARERRAKGEFIKPIADDLGLTVPGLRRHLLDIPSPPRWPISTRKVDPEVAQRLLDRGLSIKEVAERYGVTRRGVGLAIKRQAARTAATRENNDGHTE